MGKCYNVKMKNKIWSWCACASFLVSFGLYFYYFVIASLAGGLLEDVLYQVILYGVFFLLIGLGLFLKSFKGFVGVASSILLGYGAFLSFINARGYLINLSRVFKNSIPLGLSSIVELLLALFFLLIIAFLALRWAYPAKAWAEKLGGAVFYLLLSVAFLYLLETIFVGVAYHATNTFKVIYLSLYRAFLYLGLAFVDLYLSLLLSKKEVSNKAE